MGRRKDKCASAGCGKNKAPRRRYCYRCIKKAERAADPVKAAFTNLRSNAKRRGIVFELALEEFRRFCVETEYMAGVGKSKTSYSLDRKDETKGYRLDNLQVLTVSQSSSKENLRRKKILQYDWQTRTARVISRDAAQVDLPF